MIPCIRKGFVGLLALMAFSGSATPVLAQDTHPRAFSNDRIRVGISIGGTGFLGLVTEYQRGNWSAELTLGTVSFHEIAVAIDAKRYFSSGHLRPAVGAGFWSLTAWTEDGSGSVFIFRVPIALDWNVEGGHAVGLEVALNRALAVDRLDPEDDTPPSRRIVPIPGFYYRYGWAP
jgi:hypothetical protein